MRRSFVPIGFVAWFAPLLALPLAVGGCQDGPVQGFMPAPSGAGNNWNNGNSAPAVDNADAGFVTETGGQNKQLICDGMKKAQVWANMVKQPIKPPRFAAGLDLAGGDSWQGLTIEQAEGSTANPVLCQSDPQGDLFGDGNIVDTWGDNAEVWAEYLVSTRKIIGMTLWPGYVGTVDFKSPDGQHTYQIQIQSQLKKDGKNFTLDWVGSGGKNFVGPGDELYRALLNTFAPGLPMDPQGVTCFDTGRCIKGNFGDVAYFYIPAIGFALWIDNQNAPQPTPSIPTRLDMDPAKIMPYAFAQPLLKLDQQGPIATAGVLGKAANPCTLQMGLTFKDFLANCVQVDGDATANMQEKNKLLGGLSHGTERFHFDVQGVDINFTDLSLPPNDIVHDTDLPHDNDISTSFTVDQSTLGRLQNDFDANGNRDLHGSGAIYKEYARLVRANLLALANVEDGDVSKCEFPSGWAQDPNFDPNAFMANLPPYCTGFEGFITAAPPTGKNDPTNLGLRALNINSGLKLGLKLGHEKVSFCMDATGNLNSDYNACDVPYGAAGDNFQTAYAQVLKVFGKGKLANLPTEVQDVRFFFRMYTIALLKYLTVANQSPVPDLSQVKISFDNLFFDSIGAGQFELAEYVDRRYVSKTQDPTDFVFEADVKNGIMDAYVFSRDLFRGETAVYTAMLEDPVNDVPGQEDSAVLTNVFGSPILKMGWQNSSKGKSAYYCATNFDPANCDGQVPPLDKNGNVLLNDDGNPILAPYPGAFGQTLFSLGETPIKITQTYPDIQSAMVRIPLRANPYDPKSKGLPFYDILIPWLPKQPGVGFPVALSGTLDKFIETAQLDFSGTTISANVDYDAVIDPMTMQPKKDGSLEFLAVETTDFLGDVFLCQDPVTGDLLTARMYTPVANITSWISQHPNAVDACQIVIRYSPFGNYADYITSLSAGVRLGVTQGGGQGRIVDVTLFVPGQ